MIQNLIRKREINRIRIYGDFSKKNLQTFVNKKFGEENASILTWEDQHKTLVHALALENTVMLFLFVVMILNVKVAEARANLFQYFPLGFFLLSLLYFDLGLLMPASFSVDVAHFIPFYLEWPKAVLSFGCLESIGWCQVLKRVGASARGGCFHAPLSNDTTRREEGCMLFNSVHGI